MLALVYDRFGPLESMRFADIANPRPGPGEIVVGVRAASINVIDSRVRNGMLGPLVKKTFPKVPGADFAGTVLAVGNGVSEFQAGDPVFGATDPFKGGAFAEQVAVPAGQVARKPEGLSFAQAAALPIAGLAALTSLRDLGQVRRGSEVLIHGATGGVGLCAVQMAKQLGARVTAVSGASGLAMLRSLGADEVVDYRSKGGGTTFDQKFDFILNASGKFPFAVGREFLTPTGRFVEPSPTIPMFLGSKIANLFRRKKHLMLAAFPKRADLDLLAGWAAEGKLQITIAQTFPFAQAKDGFAAMEKGGTAGKIVVVF